MLEHVAKAYLAHLHPTLLVDDRVDFLSLVRLAGEGHRAGTGHVLRTVGMQGALERIGTLQANGNRGAGGTFAKRFELVLQARNGVAHVGDDGGLADEVAQLAIRGVEEILGMLNRTLDDLFVDYTAAARALLDEHSTAVHQQVSLRLARARQSFAEQFGQTGLDQQLELNAIDRMTRRGQDENDNGHPIICPACQRIGVLTGFPDLRADETTVQTNDEDPTREVALLVMLSADSFRCPVCGLRLQGEELDEAGLPRKVDVRPATGEDLAEYWGDLIPDDDVGPDDHLRFEP